jgi:transcriptional regulator with XRE-family HTH domain
LDDMIVSVRVTWIFGTRGVVMNHDFDVLRQLRRRRRLTLAALSNLSGVSYVALSKLERNQGNPEVQTLDRVAGALGISTHNLLALADHQEPIIAQERTCKVLGAADAHLIEMNGTRVYMVRAPAGAEGDELGPRRDDYEHCFVLSGCLKLRVRSNDYLLRAGQGLVWDTFFDYHYSVLEPTSFVTMLVPKRL